MLPGPALLAPQAHLPLEERLLIPRHVCVQGLNFVVVHRGPVFSELCVLLTAIVGGKLVLKVARRPVGLLDVRVAEGLIVLPRLHVCVGPQAALKIEA